MDHQNVGEDWIKLLARKNETGGKHPALRGTRFSKTWGTTTCEWKGVAIQGGKSQWVHRGGNLRTREGGVLAPIAQEKVG